MKDLKQVSTRARVGLDMPATGFAALVAHALSVYIANEMDAVTLTALKIKMAMMVKVAIVMMAAA